MYVVRDTNIQSALRGHALLYTEVLGYFVQGANGSITTPPVLTTSVFDDESNSMRHSVNNAHGANTNVFAV